MYRWLLCSRYLRTRYIALASVISVTLGVATLIVVNSVMEGFAVEMRSRMHGILSDIIIECHAADGLPHPEWHLEKIKELLGDKLQGSTTVVHVPSMLMINCNGHPITRQVNLIGVDTKTYGSVSDFGQFLLHPENRRQAKFELRESGYAPDRKLFPDWGWRYRRAWAADLAEQQAALKARQAAFQEKAPSDIPSSQSPGGIEGSSLANLGPGGATLSPVVFDPAKDIHPGIILGIATCSFRHKNRRGVVEDHYYCRPGDDIRLMFASGGESPKVLQEAFTVVDLYESGMSEYDATFAFVPLEKLQQMRGMIDPSSGNRSVSSIQLRLAPNTDASFVRDQLQSLFPADHFPYQIQTWRDLQGPLLAAVRLETTILNILLFLIIAVAGFGILATFFMIVVEKTRDIGILKSLGASSSGIMSIFLNYGLLLGIVGSGAGMVGGLLFVANINQIAGLIETFTGQEVFDPTVYYFNEIPTIIRPWTVAWVVFGAVLIAVGASVLPAVRAARLHPVQALRYE
jgi:lipoprotein-releasing system permease protein